MLFADVTLARRLEARFVLEIAEYARAMAREGMRPEAFAEPVEEGFAVYCGPGMPINRAGSIGMSNPVTHEIMEQIEAIYRKVGLPASIDLCPLGDPSLTKILGERGYRIRSYYNAHYRETMPEDLNRERAGEIEVIEVGPGEEETWVETVSRGFNPEDKLDNDLTISRSVTRRPWTRCFLARINGEPAGGGALSVHDGLGVLFSASVRVKFRKMGVQKALLETRLEVARRTGCDLVTVLTIPGNNSQRNMERQGFRVAYTRMTMVKD